MVSLRDKLKIYPLNQNKLAEAMTLIEEIYNRDKFDPMILLDEIEQETVSCTDSYRRMEMFREILKKKRYPEYSARKKKFDDTLKKMKLPPSIRVHHSPFFEEGELTVECRFSTEEEKEKIIGILNKREWTELLEVVS